MTREIKFRAWDKVKAEMKYNLPLKVDGDYGLDDVFRLLATEEKRIAVMQYTGLKDKNGVPIYEGDVVRGWHDLQPEDEPHIGIVEDWENVDGFYGFGIRTIKQVKGWGEFYSYDGLECYKLEVIGNIYENPELLGEQVLTDTHMGSKIIQDDFREADPSELSS